MGSVGLRRESRGIPCQTRFGTRAAADRGRRRGGGLTRLPFQPSTRSVYVGTKCASGVRTPESLLTPTYTFRRFGVRQTTGGMAGLLALVSGRALPDGAAGGLFLLIAGLMHIGKMAPSRSRVKWRGRPFSAPMASVRKRALANTPGSLPRHRRKPGRLPVLSSRHPIGSPPLGSGLGSSSAGL